MYELNNIEGNGKDAAAADYSSTKYTSLESSPSNISTKRSVKLNPPLWNTLEFYIHFFIVITSIMYMFYVGYHISKETNPNYDRYSKRLENGWFFGRKDNSDAQFASFRNHYGVLLLALISYLFLSHLYRIYFVPKSPAKLSTQPLRRTYFFLSFALIFLYILYGNSLIKILIILSINFLIPVTLQGSKLNPIITWIFNLAVLFANERYDAYKFKWINENLTFLDANVGLLARWDVTFNICMLRMVSFNMDYYWSYHPSPDSTEVILGDSYVNNDCFLLWASRDNKLNLDHAPLTEKDRIIGSCFKEDYNYINFLSYILYTPLFLAGPIISFNNFISQLRYPKEIDIKSTFIYGVRLLAAILTMEIMLHFIYVVAISKSRAWMGFTPFELSMVGFFNLKYIWLKLLIIWRFFRFWAMADGFEVQENMLRCMLNNYSTSGFWRSWHRSYNRWLIRYIYIPLGGAKYSTYNMLIIFTFVALWHDISLKLLAWGWLIWIFILPETIVTRIFTEKRFGDYPYYRHLCAVGGVLNLLTMWAANLVGFAVGLDGMKVLLSDIFRTSDGLISLGLCCISIFCAVQIMFEIREEEKRKNFNQEIRY
ncbi:1821_t:CDS:10 [Funneliformis geosporum]|uniref:12611_t:CDS:1 n=1 Tax=Funneliformis geosporum TaxID=1117311 RepID=A0A9W4WLP3_9GLOM|nr:12611_t:CDS:10 [Funneliformis geosporum]CAI2167373.1 1821_t:CDS:10 [Funneliformis geosporum]